MDKETLILSQIIKNVYYREKVLPNLSPTWFEDVDNVKLFTVIRDLQQDRVTKLDSSALLLKYPNKERLKELIRIDLSSENVDWLIKETEEWCKIQALKNAVMESVEIIEETNSTSKKPKRDITEIDKLVREALSVSFDQELGLKYFSDIEDRLKRYKTKDSKALSTGYQMLDYYFNGGVRGKTLGVIIAESNLGKTQALCNLSCNFAKKGMNGIYLSLELDTDIIARRHDSIITNIPYAELTLPFNEERVLKFFKNFKGTKDYFIREYPPSKASCMNIKTYIKELELYEDFKPDYLIVDYINLMKANYPQKGQNSYEKYFYVTEELREISVEYNIPVITASQIQREGYSTSSIGMENVRGSMGIMENADWVIAMTQSIEQEPDNFITWKLIKNRLGRKSGTMETQFNTETLAMTEILNEENRQMLGDSFNVETKGEKISELDNMMSDMTSDNDFGGFT